MTLGDSAFPEHATLGRVCLSAHSGGYHAAACCLRDGGVDVHETYLFDALYAESDVFRDWVLARRGAPAASRHKLVSYFTAGAPTEALNRILRATSNAPACSSPRRCTRESCRAESSPTRRRSSSAPGWPTRT